MSEITIDELSHENSLIRARNDRLEAEKSELVEALHRISWFLTIMLVKGGDEPDCLQNARALIEKPGSAT